MTNSTYTNIFGGSTIRPAQPSYFSLSMAFSVQLLWPLETTEGSPGLAAMVDVTASVTGLNLVLPPSGTGSVGAQSIITNVGGIDFTVTDNVGNQVAVLSPSQSWVIALIDNTPEVTQGFMLPAAGDLPTTLPAAAGVYWNDGGLVAVS